MTQPVFQLFNPDSLYDPSANGYSHLAEVSGAARLLVVAGQGGEQQDGTLSPSFSEQARQALANVKAALAHRGAGLENVFKLTLLIVDHSQEKLAAWVTEIDRAWGDGMKPTCTLIPVPRLALDGMLIEIEAIAAN